MELNVWQKRSPNSPAKCVVRPVNGVRRPLLAMAAVGGTYHTHCLQMNSQVYDALANSSEDWVCLSCGLPNFNSSLFE